MMKIKATRNHLISVFISLIMILGVVSIWGTEVSAYYILNFSNTGWNNPISSMSSSAYAAFVSPTYGDTTLNHCGVDLGLNDYASKSVYSIGDGYVYYVYKDTTEDKSTKNQSVVFIRHKTSNGTEFTAVYGHTEAAASIIVGASVTKGQCIGTSQFYNIYHLYFGININANINTSGTINKALNYGWGLVPKSTDPLSLGWRDPASWLSQNAASGSSNPTPTPTPPTGNFTIQYYNNEFRQGSVIYTQTANDINKNWGSGSPGGGVNSDSFSARFTGTVNFEQGYYNFHYDADDGVKVVIDDSNCIIDNNGPGAAGNQGCQLSAGNHKIVVEYTERTGDARVLVNWSKTTAPTPTPTPPTGNFTIQYFNNEFRQGSVIYTQSANDINKNWGSGSPGGGVNSDSFSAIFTGTVNFEQGYYNFHYDADDGVKVVIDDTNCIIDNNGPGAVGNQGCQLSSGNHKIVVEYTERTGDARVQVTWAKTTPPTPTPIPQLTTTYQLYIAHGQYKDVWFTPSQNGIFSISASGDGESLMWEVFPESGGSSVGYSAMGELLLPTLQMGTKYRVCIFSSTYGDISTVNTVTFSPQVQIIAAPSPTPTVSPTSTTIESGSLAYLGDIRLYSFSIDGSAGNYIITSIGTIDVVGELYDSNFSLIDSNDDGNGNSQFKMTDYLSGYQTYYLLVRSYGDYYTGDFSICVEGTSSASINLTQYTAKYDEQGGSSVDDTTATYYEKIYAPTEPILAGQTFLGWFTESTSGEQISFPYTVQSNITLYAHWCSDDFGNTPEDAYFIGSNISSAGWTGKIDSVSDIDYFSFIPATDGTYSIWSTDTSLDTIGWVLDENYNVIGSNDDYNSSLNFYIETNLCAGKTYYVGAGSFNDVTGSYTIGINLILSTVSVPTNLHAVSAGYNSSKLTWNAVSGATGYVVYRSKTAVSGFVKIASTTSTTYSNTGLTTGTTYYYKIKALKSVGTTNFYSAATASVGVKPIPATPTTLTATRVSATGIRVNWEAVPGATGYVVYRSLISSSGFIPIATTTTASIYTNVGLTTGKTYYYKVRAYRTVGTTKIYSTSSVSVGAKT